MRVTNAGVDSLAIDMHRTAATTTTVATLLGTIEAYLIAQHSQQSGVQIHRQFMRVAIDFQSQHLLHVDILMPTAQWRVPMFSER